MKLCFLLVFLSQIIHAGYGDSDGTYLTAAQRQMTVLTNAVRMDPQGYRDTYLSYDNILLPATYIAVPPVYHNEELYNACKAHTDDMVANNKMKHASSDGTLFSTRVKSYYTLSGNIAENIAAGNSDPFITLSQWLYDKVNGVPAEDNSDNDGHRKNIMNESYSAMGVATLYGSETTYGNYWCQDFGGISPVTHKIASGACFTQDNETLTFMCNYYDDGNAPTKATLFLGESQIDMTLHLGEEGKGTYIFELDNSDDNEYDYYFEFIDSKGETVRYPETETLVANSGGNKTTSVLLAPHSINSDKVLIAPNPIVDIATVVINEELKGDVIVQVLDNNQSVVFSQEFSNYQNTIDCSALTTGIYYVLVLVDGVVWANQTVYKR